MVRANEWEQVREALVGEAAFVRHTHLRYVSSHAVRTVRRVRKYRGERVIDADALRLFEHCLLHRLVQLVQNARLKPIDGCEHWCEFRLQFRLKLGRLRLRSYPPASPIHERQHPLADGIVEPLSRAPGEIAPPSGKIS